jgi:hypothetical protein
MKCPHFPNCFPINFTPAEQTREGAQTYRVACAGGKEGGCAGQSSAEVAEFNATASSQTESRTPPIQYNEFGRPITRAWEEPGYISRDRNIHKGQ